MRNHLFLLTCPLALALAACDGGDTTEIVTEDGERITVNTDRGDDRTTVKIKGPDGEEVVQETGRDVEIDLPDGFSTYPGANVVSNTVIRQGDTPGSMIMLETSDAPEKVVDYYKKQAEDAGLEIQIETDMGASLMVSAERKDDGTTMMASASRDEDQDTTTAQLIVATRSND